MSQIAQLSAAEIEARFQIAGRRAVAFTLAEYARAAVQFSVQFGDDLFVTTLLAAQPEENRLVFDCSGAESLNKRLLLADECHFSARPGGVLVQFRGGRVSAVRYEGAPAFAIDLPEAIIRLQRRDNFRIATPRVNPLRFFGRLPDGGSIDLPAFDISVGGIGLLAARDPYPLAVGMRLERCHFHLPDDTHELFFTATVQHVSEREVKSGVHQWRIGLQFADLPAGEQARIQRYIARLERERHELL